MERTTSGLKERIINESDIVDEISKDIDLQKKGANYVGLCPFHNDTEPSFTVSPEKHMYKCFSCNEGGNIITYLQKKRHMSYQDALEYLGGKLGLKVTKKKVVPKNSEHYALEAARDYFYTCLSTLKPGKPGREYLEERGYSLEIAQEYHLGYADQDVELLKKSLDSKIEEEKQFSKYEIESLKLYNEYGTPFKNRFIFPIHDDEDRVVGFTGRSLLKTQDPKYYNSPESSVFHKREVLYNLNVAKKYLSDKTIIIVEGNFDVLAFAKLGIKNVIAIMGTSFTREHALLLKKYKVRNIILCLDQDRAGIKATLEVGDELLRNNIRNISVVTYDTAKDIDEYIKNNGDVNKIMEQKLLFHEFKIDKLITLMQPKSIKQQQEFVRFASFRLDVVDKDILMPLIKRITNVATDFSSEDILAMINKTPNVEETVIEPIVGESIQTPLITEPRVVVKENKDEVAILKLMLRSKDDFHEIKKQIEHNNYVFKTYPEIFEMINEFYKTHDVINLIDLGDELGSKTNEKPHLYNFFDIITSEGINKKKAFEVVARAGKPKVAGLHLKKKKN